MKDKEIIIPKFLRELHGEKTRMSNLILVYSAGLVATVLFTMYLIPLKLQLWKLILGGTIIFDISGGVVANLSTSTNQYFRDKKVQRYIFLAIHFLQPLGLYFVFSDSFAYFIFMFLFTITASLIVNSLKDTERQQNFASFFIVIGNILSLFLEVESLIIYLIATLYMIKLILGFSVRRPSFTKS